MELKGSKTEANLMAAFAGESQARNKYDYYASRAKKDGYEQIAAIFQETALNEKEHAKMWFKLFAGIDDTKANLLAAAAGEHEEWTDMYKRFAEEAEAEGFKDIADKFRKRRKRRLSAFLRSPRRPSFLFALRDRTVSSGSYTSEGFGRVEGDESIKLPHSMPLMVTSGYRFCKRRVLGKVAYLPFAGAMQNTSHCDFFRSY